MNAAACTICVEPARPATTEKFVDAQWEVGVASTALICASPFIIKTKLPIRLILPEDSDESDIVRWTW